MQAALSLLLGGNVCSGRVAARNLATFLCFFTFETVSSLSFSALARPSCRSQAVF